MYNYGSCVGQRSKVLLEVASRPVCGRHLRQGVVQQQESEETRVHQQQEVHSPWNASPETAKNTER